MNLKRKIKKIGIIFILAAIIVLGIFLRIAQRPDLIYLNTSGFFYHRAAYLVDHGEYLKIDTKGMHPHSYPENYPPFLILFSVALYKISLSNNLLAFLSYFPIIMFVLISVAGFFFMSRSFGRHAGIFFVIMFSIVPSAARVTGKGFYTEEAVGILLFILFLYCLLRLNESKAYLYSGVIFLTLFILTWQAFVIVYAALFAMLILNFKEKELAKKISIIIIVPIILSYAISIVLLGLAYSPLQIFEETYTSFTANKELNYRIALDRSDLIPTYPNKFFDEYSYFSLFSILGIFFCIRNFRGYNYKLILIFSAFCILSVLVYLKLRYFALPMILVLSAIGLSDLYDIKKSGKKRVAVFLAIVALFFAFQIYHGIVAAKHPKCDVKIEMSSQKISKGYPYQISMVVKNNGGSPFCDSNYSSYLHAFGGVHVETENAKILSKKIQSKYTSTSIVDKQPEKNISWFEAKFDCLKPSNTAKISFEILPTEYPVKLYYRCWLPDECDLEPPKDITLQYRAFWRNENCIKRNPNRGDYCKVKVFAGYENFQDYYCYEQTLE